MVGPENTGERENKSFFNEFMISAGFHKNVLRTSCDQLLGRGCVIANVINIFSEYFVDKAHLRK